VMHRTTGFGAMAIDPEDHAMIVEYATAPRAILYV
jgi:hypothetical protein